MKTTDKITTVTPAEGLKMFLEEPHIDLTAQNEDYVLELGIDETRIHIQFALQAPHQGEAEVTYEHNAVLTRKTIQEKLAQHQRLLELLKQCQEKSLSKSIVAAKDEHELREFRLFVEPETRRLFVRIMMIFVGIWNAMNFRSPFVKKHLLQSLTDRSMMTVILTRLCAEMKSQMCAHEKAAKGVSHEPLNELVTVMKEIVYVLGEIITRDQHVLQAEMRTFEIVQ